MKAEFKFVGKNGEALITCEKQGEIVPLLVLLNVEDWKVTCEYMAKLVLEEQMKAKQLS